MSSDPIVTLFVELDPASSAALMMMMFITIFAGDSPAFVTFCGKVPLDMLISWNGEREQVEDIQTVMHESFALKPKSRCRIESVAGAPGETSSSSGSSSSTLIQ